MSPTTIDFSSNALLGTDTLSAWAPRGIPGTFTGRNYTFNGGSGINSSNVPVRVAAGSLTLPDNSVCYVERTYAGVVSTNTTGFTGSNIPMAKVTTASGAITVVEDWRPMTGAFPYYAPVASETGVIDLRYAVGELRRYGAIGSNSTADGLAIRNAITSVKALGRGKVLVPVGNWYLAEVAAQGIVLPDGVYLEGVSRLYSIIHATGVWTDSVVRAENRDDNNANSYVTPGLKSLQLKMDSTSAVVCLDLCGVRNGRFVDLHLEGSGTGNGQTAMRLADRNLAGTSNKSCFFNHLEAIDGSGGGWGTWFQAAQYAGNCSTNTFIQGNAYCRVAFDFTQYAGLPSAHNVFLRHYMGGDSHAASASHKGGVVGAGLWSQCDFEGFTTDVSATYGMANLGVVPSSASEPMYLGNLAIPSTGYFTLGGLSPLMSGDVLVPGIISGLTPTANSGTTVRVGSGGVPSAAYNGTWLADPNDIVLTHTNTGAPHTEYVVLNNLSANSINSRVVIQQTAPTGSQVLIATCTIDATGNRTALTDSRVLGAGYPRVRGLSATSTAAKNLRGSVTISGASTSTIVVFPNTETDLNFFVQITPSATTGTPAAGSTRAYATLKTSTGFTVTLEVAPGAGNSVTIDWFIVR